MRVIAVDDERIILDDFISILEKMPEICSVEGFTKWANAVDYVKNNVVDVAFLDIRMRGMDGITLAKKLKEINPLINIIFCTAHDEYTMDALKLHASGYLMKPVVEEDVRKELQDLRIPIEKETVEKRIKVNCFGNFEIYIDGLPCQFKYAKSKELLAYLIDRKGAFVTNGEILNVLWEDKEVTASLENYLRNLIVDIRAILRKANLENAIAKKKGMIAIVPEEIDCDYFKWINGDETVANAFNGEYMTQYSWSEFTLAGIENRLYDE